MRMNSILKAFIATTFGIGVLAGASQMASAQICPSSKLYYIVRDAKGTPSAAARADLRFQPFPGWGVVKDAFVGDKIGAPPNVLNGKAAALMTSEMCSFREEPTLKLTLDGKSMNLTFHTRPLPGYQSSTYFVDALPFQQGTFEIDVPNEPDNRFYAATGWKKVSDAAEAVPEPSHSFLHGQVIDALTKKPIAGARVSLLSWLANEMGKQGTVTTDGAGLFKIDGLRDDYMVHGWDIAVVTEHPDYANTYVLFYPSASDAARDDPKTRAPFKSIENAVVELIPLATVSGRVIDAETGGVPGDLDRVDVTFTYRKSGYLPGGNIEYPTGEVKTKLNADGSFTIRTEVGKNFVTSVEGWWAGSCGKCYSLTTDDERSAGLEIEVPNEGRSDLLLKLKSKSK